MSLGREQQSCHIPLSLCPPPPPAQTSLDFLFHFGVPMEDGPHPGLYSLAQPVAGMFIPLHHPSTLCKCIHVHIASCTRLLSKGP